MGEDLRQAYAPVERHLDAMEALLAVEMTSEEPFLREFLDHFARYGGKRVRPALLFLFGEALGEVREAHVRVGAAAELVHLATLIHDDILDEASVRRQLPTANRLWGNERSVLLGDWVFAKAFEIVARVGDIHVVERLVATSREVCQGEMLQICHRFDIAMEEDRYLALIRMKTGALFGFCCEMGAALSGSPPAVQEACRQYGTGLGVAFQIVDDCLDVTGREDVVGKSLGTDLVKGKMTLPLIRALAILPAAPRAALLDAFRNGSGRGAVRPHLEAADAVAYSRDRARDFTDAAKKSLEAIDGAPVRRQMEVLADFVVDRPW